MGAIFNTDGTLEIIGLLSKAFTKNFSSAASNGGLKGDLGNAGMKSRDVASGHGLNPGNAMVTTRWHKWLDFFDGNGGASVRADMVNTLNNTTRYEAIEFFAVPDPNFTVTFSDFYNSTTGKYSRIVSVRTPTIDSLP